MRLERSLAGQWEFQLDPNGTLDIEELNPPHSIPVPLPWQAALPELQHYSGYAWYRQTIDLDSTWLAGEVLLKFGAVDYWCEVFVNGRRVGEHEGGYTPFTFPIRGYVHAGLNDIAVRVYDAAQTGIHIPRWPNYRPEEGASGPPFDAEHIPHGKQEWYINVGGIWQDVTLTAVPRTYIERVHVTPNIHTGQAQIEVELAGGPPDESGTLYLHLSGDHDEGQSSLTLTADQRIYQTSIAVAQPRLWDIDTPYLYAVTVTLDNQGATDALEVHFGFRELTMRDGQLLLNGRPLFLLAALDQDLYPDTIYTVPSVDYLRDQFLKAKQLGLNCLRCHIKPPDPRYLDLADEMGLLIWAEIPSWRTFHIKGTTHPHQLDLHQAIRRRVEQTLAEMVRRDYNHPSLVIWTIVNEDWGTALPLSASDRAWVAEMYDRCKQWDPTRLVVDNSACLHAWGPNIHVKSDLDDFHIYANIPDQARYWVQSMDQFGLRPLWTYTSQGEAQRTGQEPLILSEFGNWGLPSLQTLRQAAGGADPAWFNIGAWWNPYEGEPGWPAGADQRFVDYGLDKIWGDYETFAVETQWHQYAAMKFEIEVMRRQPSLAGYVITEFTDAYWESNGLLDFYRRPKVYHNEFAIINAPDVVTPQVGRYAWWDDEPLIVWPHVAHFSAADWPSAHLRIQGVENDAGLSEGLPSILPGEVRALDARRWPLPTVPATQRVAIEFRVDDDSQTPLARNRLDLLVLPASARQAAYGAPLAVLTTLILDTSVLDVPALSPQSPDLLGPQSDAPGAASIPGVRTDLAVLLQRVGYQTTRQFSADSRVAVTTYPNAELLRWVRQGGSLLYISRGPGPFFWAQGRTGAYSGNWMSSFSWLRPEIHRRLGAAPNPLGLPFMYVMPQRTILGLPVEDRGVQDDFLAGMIVGWVRHPSVHTVQFRYGQGRVIMTTFALEEGLRLADPVAIALCHDLIDHLVSDACQPTLTANY